MFIEFLTPEVFDAIVIANIGIGLLIAGRRFAREIGGPLPDDAPDWARLHYDRSNGDSSFSGS